MKNLKVFAAALLSLMMLSTPAQANPVLNGLDESDIADFIGGLIGGGRGHRDHREGRHGRPQRVVKSLQIRADKLMSDPQHIQIWESAALIRLTALKSRVSFVSDLQIIGGNRYPMNYHLYDLREGESIMLDVREGYGYPMFIDSMVLHIESPSIIGSRGVLQIDLIR